MQKKKNVKFKQSSERDVQENSQDENIQKRSLYNTNPVG